MPVWLNASWSYWGRRYIGSRHLRANVQKITARGSNDWVFNGEKLYRLLGNDYPHFDGQIRKGSACIETFPHAVVCAMAGRVVLAQPKATVRRSALQNRGYGISGLSNIDFVDAALCAVAADEFLKDNYKIFGNREEGFIIVPRPHT